MSTGRMKLTFKKKKPASKQSKVPQTETVDAGKRLLITKKLRSLSERVRLNEIEKTPAPLKREQDDQPKSPLAGLSVTVTKTVTKKKEDDPATETDEEKKLWAARSMYGRHLPVLQCNSCSISRVCPKYRAGYECAYLPYLNNHKIRNELDLVKYMKLLVGNQMRRTQLMAIIESANGGMPSLETSEAMESAFRQLKELHEVIGTTEKSEMSITGDATVVNSIFGNIKLTKLHEDTKQMANIDLVPMDIPNSIPTAGVPQVAPALPLPSGDPLSNVEEVSRDLVRDVMLSKDDRKKVLQPAKISTVEISNLSKG